MQISRHWRIKQQRYRLEGVRLQNGEVSLHNRPVNTTDREVAQPSPRENQRVGVGTIGR